jgi:hypothetical protein
MVAAAIVGGGETIRTGDLGKGFMAGLGAFGGAGLGGALGGAGSLGAQAAGAQGVLDASGINEASITAVKDAAIKDFASQPLLDQAQGSLATLGQPGGLSNLGSNLMGQYGGKYGAMAAAYPLVSEAMRPPTVKFPDVASATKSNYAGPYVPTPRDVRFKPEDDTSTSEFTYFTPSNPVPGYQPRYAAQGGYMQRYQEGGSVEDRAIRMPTDLSRVGTVPEFNYNFRPIEVMAPPQAAKVQPTNFGDMLSLVMRKIFDRKPNNTDLSKYKYNPNTQRMVPMAQGGLAALNAFNKGITPKGGRFLQGPGDGTSDSIPATIGNAQPARLADGEFVIDARTVSEIGNGSSNAGAKKLYAMMERVHRERKKAKRGQDSNADRFLPK